MDNLTEANKKFQKELNSGTTALVLLSLLSHAKEPLYGYRIAKLLEASDTSGTSLMKQGALYPVLRSLEGIGLLKSTVDPSVSGPPRRYYRITDSGREVLKNWKDIWSRTKEFVDRNLGE